MIDNAWIVINTIRPRFSAITKMSSRNLLLRNAIHDISIHFGHSGLTHSGSLLSGIPSHTAHFMRLRLPWHVLIALHRLPTHTDSTRPTSQPKPIVLSLLFPSPLLDLLLSSFLLTCFSLSSVSVPEDTKLTRMWGFGVLGNGDGHPLKPAGQQQHWP
ncbi:hypothetical protein ACIRRA_13455 [Nocardia sp. NPDC101769]|uniref:hypothetical protein n=1 Tax=Nocardia sp. NPDC101769 TaxID=3364333 RepID=UPI00380343C3